MGNNGKTLCCIFLTVVLILVSIGLIACVVYISLAPTRLRQCQEQLKNDTSALMEKFANLEEDKGALEKQWDRARAEVMLLRSELTGTNQTLWETRGRWDSCRSLTHDLQNNITALKDEITQLGRRDAEQGREQDEIVKLRQQLQEARQQRDKLQADIQQLEQQQRHSQKNQSSGGSSLRIPIVAGYLSLLALSLTGILLL
ncbi:uncharacterized protein LOC119848326 [Dermochelys coriacea]|uniref:uncharacterized protein LOC119848326 n=1 Tax=Dermochelys coriacea TaxID=27794 RepID=UPI0018E77272|nr:uncharacterized protein LOC119848326 [Dermochelys coriacea]XP_038239934.1 uncharacterized protein LOC119848326 [Dermochelys coriacea]XP_038239935.1 uncharacterized protein LOC119848326 [Dermochelys coriacea]XP_038239936.1 uncharacterized protein LOC119848326 [Dermochelys coriacea]XP_043358576.1 uncharacterized protein LOC119848326 [Dermochelys coriacea]XP_043358577.1 uncharacterized protein LOC119848326 [Dermochelys coriacea]